nr:helix-turn-helix domain-containing protein [uncultured Sulfitobacter sp.]
MTQGDDTKTPRSWSDQVGDGPFSMTFHEASELIGKRWTGAIIRTLFHGKTRFREIADAIPGMSDKLLSTRLKELEHAGIIRPTDTERGYALTEKGKDLRLILIEIAKWAHRWAQKPDGEEQDK